MDKEKRAFLDDELHSLTLMATLQRSCTYTEKAKDGDKAKFRDRLRELLNQFSPKYKTVVDENLHMDNILSICETLSNEFSHILANGRFRIGGAQKALNLFLKYLWCMGEIDNPPHCPFDYVIIRKLNKYRNINWTSLDDIETYKGIVKEAKALAGDKGLAEWELETYNAA